MSYGVAYNHNWREEGIRKNARSNELGKTNRFAAVPIENLLHMLDFFPKLQHF